MWTPLEKAIWRQSCQFELPQLVQHCSKIDFVLSANVIPQLMSVLCPILIVNGIPRCTSLDDNTLDALDLALRADYVCQLSLSDQSRIVLAHRNVYCQRASSFGEHDDGQYTRAGFAVFFVQAATLVISFAES